MKKIAATSIALACIAMPAPSSAQVRTMADDPACTDALDRYTTQAGLPKSLGFAIAMVQARPRSGGMSPYMVTVGETEHVAKSAPEARTFAEDAFRRGAASVEVGCLGVKVARGDSQGLAAALDPDRNVALSIGSTVSKPGGGGRRQAAPPAERDFRDVPVRAVRAQPPVSPPAATISPAEQSPPPPVYGGRSDTAGKGGVGATWGLFTNSPVSNPVGASSKD